MLWIRLNYFQVFNYIHCMLVVYGGKNAIYITKTDTLCDTDVKRLILFQRIFKLKYYPAIANPG